jgi:Uma2 family endonuclease
VALLRRRPGYDAALPGAGDVLLIVEVADSSLGFDRETKLPMYAAHGIPEVWIVNLADDCVEAYREPAPGGFRAARTHARDAALSPLRLPDLALDVDAALGPA